MHDCTERVDRLALQQDVDLNQCSLLLAGLLVVEAGVTAGARLQRVEEIEDDLAQRHGVAQLDTFRREVVHSAEFAAARLTQFHDGADELTRRDHRAFDHRLVDQRDLAVGPVRWVGDDLLGAVLADDPIHHVR